MWLTGSRECSCGLQDTSPLFISQRKMSLSSGTVRPPSTSRLDLAGRYNAGLGCERDSTNVILFGEESLVHFYVIREYSEVLAVLCSVLPLVVGGGTATIVRIWMRQLK